VRFHESEAKRILEKHRIPVGESGARAPKQYAVNVTYDAARKRGVITANDRGGQDMEDVAEAHPDRVARRHFSTIMPLSDYRAKELVADLGLTGRDLVRMTGIVARLVEVFFQYDLTQAEINPLVQLEDGSFAALSCQLDMEEEARFRQKEILDEFGIEEGDTRAAREPTPFEIEAARIDAEDPRGIISPVAEFDGDMGLVIGAGGGSLTKLILSKPGVDKIAVISNVVSNTRADLVARGVIKGVLELGFEPAEKITIFRVPGAWETDAFKILEKYGIEFCDRSVSLSEAASRAVAKAQAAGS
jgi:succinyl-CoA synthetase beta subunit/citryl-CoA synthetase large subunit